MVAAEYVVKMMKNLTYGTSKLTQPILYEVEGDGSREREAGQLEMVNREGEEKGRCETDGRRK